MLAGPGPKTISGAGRSQKRARSATKGKYGLLRALAQDPFADRAPVVWMAHLVPGVDVAGEVSLAPMSDTVEAPRPLDLIAPRVSLDHVDLYVDVAALHSVGLDQHLVSPFSVFR